MSEGEVATQAEPFQYWPDVQLLPLQLEPDEEPLLTHAFPDQYCPEPQLEPEPDDHEPLPLFGI